MAKAPKTGKKDATTERTKSTSILTSSSIVVGLLAFLLYSNTLGHQYALDDFPTIYGNRLTMSGLDGIPTLMKTAYWYGMDGQNDWLYRPLSMVMFAIEWEITDGEPWLGHLMNVLLYVLTSVVLLRVLSKLFQQYSFIIPLSITLLWVAHPIHTEVVANIKSRDELLALLFSLLALQAAISYVENTKLKHLAMVFVCYLIAMFSKESPITMLAVVPLSLAMLPQVQWRKIAITMVPMILGAGIYLFVRGQVLTTQTGGDEIPWIDNSLMAAPDILHQQAMAFYVLGMYLKLMIFPVTMSSDYSYRQIPVVGFDDPWALISLLIMVAVGIYAVVRILKKDPVGYGVLFYLIGISLVANVLFLTRSTAADRFLFYPGIGMCIALIFLLTKALKMDVNSKIKFESISKLLGHKSSFSAILLVVLLVYSLRTWSRNKDWENDTTIFTADVENAPNSARIHFLHANHLLQDLKQGKTAVADQEKNYGTSLIHFSKAIELLPTYNAALNGLGEAYTYRNRYKDAIRAYEMAIEANAQYPDAYNNLGNIYFRIEQYDKGITYLQKAIALDSTYFTAYSNLGTCYFGKGQFDQARDYFLKAIELAPWFADPYKNLGSCYGMMGDLETSTEYFLKALEFNPNDKDILKYVVMNYQNTGDIKSAEAFQQRLNRIQ